MIMYKTFRLNKLFLFIFLLMIVPFEVAAAPIGSTPPNLFQNGQTTDPIKVNENFTKLYAHLFEMGTYIKKTFVSGGSLASLLVDLGKKGDNVTVNLPAGFSNFGVAPLGSIVAWYPLQGAPPLAEGWVRCDGQTLTDTEVPSSLRNVPDLNNAKLFLRGESGSTPGTIQQDQIITHVHGDFHSHFGGSNALSVGETSSFSYKECSGTGFGSTLFSGSTATGLAQIGAPSTAQFYDPVRHGDETRPKNMSVVWIMRVK